MTILYALGFMAGCLVGGVLGTLAARALVAWLGGR